MEISIWTDAFVELEVEECVRRLAEAGWRTMELAGKHCNDLEQRTDPEGHFKSLRKLLDDLGVSMPQMHGPGVNVCGEDRPDMEKAFRAMRFGAILGVKLFVWHASSGRFDEDEEDLKRVRDANAEAIGRLAEEGRKLGMKVAIENLMDGIHDGLRTFTAVPAELIWLIDGTDPENVGVCWDTGHAHLQRLDQGKAIRTLGSRIIATHIADNDTSRDQHLLPFEGTIDWKAVMSALRETGYSGTLNLEIGGAVHPVPLPVRGAKVRYALELTRALAAGEVAC